ncbi:hypothetical protein LCGC14_0488810 [marine sediment metagenome]|uniref:Post-SET domain-containing protein n=1 Tax=marine sediment metagenome TaxID=412755 RepID=A0A0F9SCJ8_9ZZZZ
MHKKYFETMYCKRSNITKSSYNRWRVTLPCACGYDGCRGWAAVSRNEDMIKDHMELYAPKEEK